MGDSSSQQCGDGNANHGVDLCQIIESIDRNSMQRQKSVQETSQLIDQNLRSLKSQTATNRATIEKNLEILRKRKDEIQKNVLEMKELARLLRLKMTENSGGGANGENQANAQ